MSASAPLGSPRRNTGSDDAVCTSAISVGDEVSVVICQAAATSFIHMHALEASHTSHNMRKVGSLSGAHAECLCSFGSSGAGRFSLMRQYN